MAVRLRLVNGGQGGRPIAGFTEKEREAQLLLGESAAGRLVVNDVISYSMCRNPPLRIRLHRAALSQTKHSALRYMTACRFMILMHPAPSALSA